MRPSDGRSRPRLVVFESSRSGPCRRFEGLLAQILASQARRRALEVVRVPVDERVDLAARFRVEAVPTLFVVEGKQVQARLEQPRHLDQLEAFLAPWLPQPKKTVRLPAGADVSAAG